MNKLNFRSLDYDTVLAVAFKDIAIIDIIFYFRSDNT